MNRSARALALVAAAVTIAGCTKEEGRESAPGNAATAASATSGWVTDLATVANAVEQQPRAADSILLAHAMTRAAFDSLIYEVAEDSALTAQFEQARKQ